MTYHGPGQLVAYPIVAPVGRGLLLRPFVRALEAALVETCAAYGVAAARRDGHPGCWCRSRRPAAAQDRRARAARRARRQLPRDRAQRRRVDLADFDLIDPCGMPGVASTSIAARAAANRPQPPTTASVEQRRPASSPAHSPPRLGAPLDRDLTMAAGLFELRKDPITGWWVATVVDRAFHRDRFARAAEPIDDRLFGCANCSTPDGRRRPRPDAQGLRLPRRRDRRRRPRARQRPRPGRARRRRARPGSWRTIVAPPGEHRPLHAVGNRDDRGARRATRATRSPRRAASARPTTSRSSRTGAPRPARGPTTCASTCTTCPRSRTGSPRRWAARPAS